MASYSAEMQMGGFLVCIDLFVDPTEESLTEKCTLHILISHQC